MWEGAGGDPGPYPIYALYVKRYLHLRIFRRFADGARHCLRMATRQSKEL